MWKILNGSRLKASPHVPKPAVIRAAGFLFIAWLATAPASLGMSGEVHLSYGAGTVGSTINSVVLAHTALFNEKIPGLRISAEASGGGVDNIRLTEDDEFQISTSANISAWQAVNGVGDFEDEVVEHVLGLTPIYPSYVMIVVPKNSPIQSLADLKGKRVSVGVKGSGAEVIVFSFIHGAGMGYGDFTPYYLAQSESNDGIKDGSLDAVIYATGIPMPAVMELNAVTDVRLLPISHEEAARIVEPFPFFSPGVIPAGTYDGMDEDVPTIQGFTIGFVRDSVPDDIVYQMAKTIWENIPELAAIHSSQTNLEPSMIRSGLLPVMDIHPGADRYYREQGWIE